MPSVSSRIDGQQGHRVVVVGGSTIDIEGVVSQKDSLNCGDSIPGRIGYAVGGVGRNIAENLARLGVDTWLVSAVGDDPFGTYVREQTATSGVDVSGLVTIPDQRTGCYLSLLNSEREMVSAVSDVDVALALTSSLDRISPIISKAEVLVLDCNVSEEMLAASIELCPRDALIVAEPVSATKALKLRPFLDRLTLVTPNQVEAESLCGLSAANEHTIEELARLLRRSGVAEVIVTLGKRGVYWSGAETDRREHKLSAYDEEARGTSGSEGYYCPPAVSERSQSVTGAGDAFTAGVVYGKLCGYDGVEGITVGFAAAAIAIESERAVNPLMSPVLLKKQLSPLSKRQ